MLNIKALVKLMRPKQWVKNAFVMAPLVFSGLFLSLESVLQAITATVLFCIASSATYILNDYKDVEDDRKHPVKSKTRPLASGDVTKHQALVLMTLLYGLVAIGLVIHFDFVVIILCYLALNVVYTIYLKYQPVLDIFTIASGFVLRVYTGTVAISVPLSPWMLVTTFALALYLAAIKRRQELAKNGSSSRNVLNEYSVELMDRYAEMSATCAVIFYSLFVMTSKMDMVLSIPFVLFGLYRYWFVVDSLDGGESPTDALFSDFQLQTTIIAWVAVCLYTLWP
ncbi:decaprenyl-phosphate phosphoribosyltransferase [Vibrio algarum]|uniref:Decaprenyl-phosphate phosphoribosyltransferase n=1 Tax=Vibrio algarum TaxID=3020714 RepID=A0ABT4YMH0_9VIBR|nr:decaprenyl-phosphate phosphoribosyltransferase [Vibrio sp. KJ40-1]MDB1122421.1 decaprenyl-phosphate phosphoribosyltransferase [Vibrio sp. KJ40-1]